MNKAIKEKETKYEKFKRLAEKRVNNIINDMRILGNLANKNNYNYKKSDINKIFKTIDDGVKKLKYKFQSTLDFEEFSLD